MQKGQTQVLILAGIVILLALAGGIFYLGRVTAPKPQPQNVATSSPQPSPTSQPTPTIDETTNWKTYTNTKFGYSVKYPNNWFICEYDQDKADIRTSSDLLHSIEINSIQTDCSSVGLNDFSVFVYNKSDLSAQFEIRQTNKSKLSNITFAGTNAVKSEETGNIYMFKGNYFYAVNGDLSFKQNPEIINQILSTFRID